MIVPVTEANLTDAAEVRALSWQASHRAICSPEFIAAHTPAQQADFLRHEMEAGKQHFLCIAERPVGVVTVTNDTIEGLYIHPEAQRQGHGSALLRFAMTKCIGRPKLWVLNTNPGAQSLYARCGFVRTGQIKPHSPDLWEIEMQAVVSLNLHAYWQAVLRQDAEAMADFFTADAYVNWHNTNEHFTAAAFVAANCAYPGEWAGEIERCHLDGDCIITVTHVYTPDRALSFHVTSFMHVREGRIAALDEYWSDDAEAPAWRQAMQLSTPIREVRI